jgi:hypothetical protein
MRLYLIGFLSVLFIGTVGALGPATAGDAANLDVVNTT